MNFEIEIKDNHGDLIEVIEYDKDLQIISVGQYSETKGSIIHYDRYALVWLQNNEPYLWSKYELAVGLDWYEKLVGEIDRKEAQVS